MNRKKTIIISLIVVGILLIAIPVAVYLVKQQQTINSRAQNAANTTAESCTPPAAVENVRVEYPNCEQGSTLQCSFTEANCTWDQVTGAQNYNVKVTETDTNTVVKTDKVTSGTTKVVFPVVTGRTYQCDISAVNSCGARGGTGTDSLLCKVDGIFGSPSPTPSPSVLPSPSPSPRPSPSPVPTPSPSPPPVTVSLGCGYTQCNNPNVTCDKGLTCVSLAIGGSACAFPDFATACSQNPSVTTCCSAQKIVQKPVLPKSGDLSATQILGGIGIGLAIIGGMLLVL